MCGRFSVYGELSEIRMNVGAQLEQLFRPWTPRYNISPSAGPGFEQLIAVVNPAGQRVLKLARWWFIPKNWTKPLNQLPTTFNARAEDLPDKALWRGAFKHGRCLVPATGWREFSGSKGKKQPYHFQLASDRIFAFAGLKSTWISPDGEVIDTFSIITTDANDTVKPVHDRMPLVVPSAMYDDWLNENDDPREVLEHLRDCSRQLKLDSYPTDPVANDTKYEGPLAVKRVESVDSAKLEPPATQGLLFGDSPEFVPQRTGRRRS